jgi:hypothetical protein
VRVIDLNERRGGAGKDAVAGEVCKMGIFMHMLGVWDNRCMDMDLDV